MREEFTNVDRRIFAVANERARIMIYNLRTRNSRRGGFIAFSSLLIISAVVLAASMSISLLGIGQANSALGFMKGQEVLKIAEGCVEESLLRLRREADYLGGSLNLGSGSCTINVTGVGNQKTVDVVGTIVGPPQFVRKIQITAKRLGNSINVINWTQIE
jgi:hypothetical protein